MQIPICGMTVVGNLAKVDHQEDINVAPPTCLCKGLPTSVCCGEFATPLITLNSCEVANHSSRASKEEVPCMPICGARETKTFDKIYACLFFFVDVDAGKVV